MEKIFHKHILYFKEGFNNNDEKFILLLYPRFRSVDVRTDIVKVNFLFRKTQEG